MANPAMGWAERRLTRTGAVDPGSGPVRFPAPVVFLMGRYDLHTPFPTARDYFDRIETLSKRFVTFERASHVIMFEEPGRFLPALVNDVLPLAGGAKAFPPRPDPIRRR